MSKLPTVKTRSAGRTVPSNGNNTSGNGQPRVQRIFSFPQMIFFLLAYLSSWEALIASSGAIWGNGGPAALVWGHLVVVPVALAQAASLSEMSSLLPIAGAQYHWTWHLAPPNMRKGLTWLQGWLTWASWIALLAGISNVAANITTNLAAMNYENYSAVGWHTVLIMFGFLIFVGLMNTYLFWMVPWLEFVAGLLHIALFVVYGTILLAMAPRHSTDFVFFTKSKLSGWEPDLVSFMLGILPVTWGFVGFEAGGHVSEDTKQPTRVVPWSTFASIGLNAIMSFAIAIVLMYGFGNVEENSASSYPIAAVLLEATKSKAGTSVLILGHLSICICAAVGSVASASRLTWSWARDRALPSWFATVDAKYLVPARSVWLCIALTMVLSLLNLTNSYTAFGAILSLTTAGLYQTYILAIACMMYARFSGRLEKPRWSLGRWGVFINGFALVGSVWIGIFHFFPTYLPVTASNLNYALPINALVWIFAGVSYWFWAKKNWPGLDEQLIWELMQERDTKREE